jgi:GntR family transcriptional repressor for pyruvate dehydrogenase complex
MAARRPAPPWQREKPELIADDLRARILGKEFDDGEVLGRELELVAQFGVSRPCLREALRILVTVVRGSRGGVAVHVPDRSVTARMAAMFLQARGVPLADVHAARVEIEPAAARRLANDAARRAALEVLGNLVAAQDGLVDDPAAFGPANASFHHTLVALAGNRTLAIVTEVLDEVIDRTVGVAALAVAQPADLRRRAIRSQRELLEYLEAGDAEGAERHWRRHLEAAGSVVLGTRSADVVDGTSTAR